MSYSLVVNGNTYVYPQLGEENWGTDASNWANAVTSGMLQKAGGTFTLTAEVDFGATYGLKTAYYKSRGSNAASAGILRLANTETIAWRNAGNSANVTLSVDASDQLVPTASLVPSATNTYDVGVTGTRWRNLFLSGDGDIAGNLAVSGTLSSGAYTVTDLTVSGNTIIGSNSSDTLTINATLPQLKGPDQTAAAPTYSWANDPDTGMYRGGSGIVTIASNGSDVLVVGTTTVLTRLAAADLPTTVASTATINAMVNTTSHIELSGSTATTINGITAGIAGQEITVTSVSANLTVNNQSGSASGANRIYCPQATNFSMTAPCSFTARYSTAAGSWVVTCKT